MDDVIADITSDHRTVQELLARVEQQPGPIDRDIVDQIVRELSIHAAAEELVLYPAVDRIVPAGNILMQGHLHEHQLVKELLVDIERSSGADLRALLNALAVYVRHHVHSEENDLLPALRDHATETEMRDIGSALEDAKRIAPTHAHPHAPRTPPANVPAGLAASAVDRLRDAVAGRSRR